jgi:HlyD family secretion protein
MSDKLSSDLASLRIDRNAPAPPSSLPKLIAWAGAAALAVGGYFMLAPYVEAKLFKTEVSETEITLISPAQASIELTAAGYVKADLMSRIAPKVPGRVLSVKVKQGDQVEAGQVLLELDPADDAASIRAAQSEVMASIAQSKSAKARAEVSRADLAEAEKRATRERTLANQGVATTAGAEDLESRVASLKQAVSAAEADSVAAEAQAQALSARVSVLQTGLRNLSLTAPIRGMVINRPPQIGEYIGPQPPGVTEDMGGIRVADLSTLIVETDVAEARLSVVKPEAPVEIVLDAYPSQRYRGVVKQITPQVDRAKATVVVKVAFVDATTGVLPDMSARVSFLTKALDEAKLKEPPKLIVPGSAITERAGGKAVFVIDEGKARLVPIQLGAPFGDGFELSRGPTAGTKVIANPPETLADGQAIKLAED